MFSFCSWVAGHIVDALTQPDPMPIITRYSLFLLGYAAGTSVCAWISYVAWIRISSRIGIKLRRMLLKSYVTNDVTFFDTHPIGDLLSLLSNDVKTVENAFAMTKATQARAIGQFLSSLLVSFSVSWELAILNLCSVLAGSFLVKAIRRFGTKHMKLKSENLGKATTVAAESLANARIVYSFNRQDEEVRRYDEEVGQACLHEGRNRLFVGVALAEGWILNWGTVSTILNLGCYMILQGRVTPGELFGLARACFIGGIGLRNCLATWHQETVAMDAADRIFAIVDEKPVVPPNSGHKIENFRGKIEFRNVWFKYPTRPTIWVLKNVSFTVEAGEISAFVGHSGSGKSTLVQLLLRFYDVDQGEVLFDDVPLRFLNPRWIHQVIGVVQQEPQLFAMSIRDNICYAVGRAASEDAVIAAATAANAVEFIERFDDRYDTLVTERGQNLSGGQRQRVAIARAILRNPTILITDEATSALDAVSEKEVQRSLDAVMQGRTSLIIAHRLGTIRAARMIYVFDSGELVEQGVHEELLARQEHYAHLVARQLAERVACSASEDRLDTI
jgi:ABC-type multidrug transport system fused ATPase/permease subunit